MKFKNIRVTRTVYNQAVVVNYDEYSTNDNFIDKKELTIQSIASVQLLIASMTDADSNKLNEVLVLLEQLYTDLEYIITGEDNGTINNYK